MRHTNETRVMMSETRDTTTSKSHKNVKIFSQARLTFPTLGSNGEIAVYDFQTKQSQTSHKSFASCNRLSDTISHKKEKKTKSHEILPSLQCI